MNNNLSKQILNHLSKKPDVIIGISKALNHEYSRVFLSIKKLEKQGKVRTVKVGHYRGVAINQ